MKQEKKLITLGWREWVSLPGLGIGRIKAKIDTGARTSALHAFDVETIGGKAGPRVRFQLHPVQRDNDQVITCEADIVDQRIVTDSGGHKEERFVIQTQLILGQESWPIEMTLTSRDDMLFRMLIGRTALKHRAIVDPARSYVVGKKKKKVKSK